MADYTDCNINYYTEIMRNVVNISLPENMVKVVEDEVKSKNFSTKSEFFRMLLRLWMEKEMADELEKSRKELRQGKGKLLKSLKDLR